MDHRSQGEAPNLPVQQQGVASGAWIRLWDAGSPSYPFNLNYRRFNERAHQHLLNFMILNGGRILFQRVSKACLCPRGRTARAMLDSVLMAVRW